MNEPYRIEPDPWLASMLGKNACRLTPDPAGGFPGAGERLRGDLDRLGTRGPLFIDAKLPVSGLDGVACLEKNGFHLIDTQIVLSKRLDPVPAEEEREGIRLALPADRDPVGALAGSSFRFSRFHLDPRTRAVADRIKSQWVTNYFEGKRGDALVVSEEGEEITGFLLLLLDADRTGMSVDLIAVDPHCQGRGIGKKMIRFAERQLSQCATVRTGTQVANTPSLKFYARLGFEFSSAQYVFHYHRD